MARSTEKQANAAIRSVENELNKTKGNKKMKKLTINPQVVGAIKLITVLAILAAVFYGGTQYQEQYHTQVTSEAKTLVTQLKIKAQ